MLPRRALRPDGFGPMSLQQMAMWPSNLMKERPLNCVNILIKECFIDVYVATFGHVIGQHNPNEDR